MSITHRLVVDVMGSWIGGTPFLLRLPGQTNADICLQIRLLLPLTTSFAGRGFKAYLLLRRISSLPLSGCLAERCDEATSHGCGTHSRAAIVVGSAR